MTNLLRTIKILLTGKVMLETSDLQNAVLVGDLEYVKRLLKDGADPNMEIEGTSPLQVALIGKNMRMIELLIGYGADIMMPQVTSTFKLLESSGQVDLVIYTKDLYYAKTNNK